MHNIYKKGFAMPAIVAIVAIVLIGGGLWYANTTSNEDMMEQKAKDIMEEGEKMMKDGEAMMEEGDAMKKEGEAMMPERGHKGNAMMEEDAMKKEGDAMEKDGGAMEEVSFSGEVIAGSASPLLEFNEPDYQKALAGERLVVLYFYANWCPICKKEFKDTTAAFDELSGDRVVGFRVHFNDNETTDRDKELAREFGVGYQHTKVFIKNGERVLKSPESWSRARYMEEIGKFIN